MYGAKPANRSQFIFQMGHHGERLRAGEAYNRLLTLSFSLIGGQSLEILQIPQTFPV
jgi:hypothetical protein